MDHALTRRGLLAGMGAAAGAAALATGVGPAAARVVPGGQPSAAGGTLGPSVDPPLTPGLTYRMIDGVAFTPRDFDNAWPRAVQTQGVDLSAGGTLVASLDLPVGATLKEVTIFYESPTGSNVQQASVQRKPTIGAYDAVAPPAPLNQGPSLQAFTFQVNETINGTATYSVFVSTFDQTQVVGGLRFGYISPAQAFTPISPITRVLDTRNAGGKLNPGEERTVSLGVPGNASAAVFNITVTETEAGGFVAVFPAGVTWPGNSTINWFAAGQNLANGVISAVNATGQITVRGGVNKTHVVIDVQGYLM
jgi:hypothetical protein